MNMVIFSKNFSHKSEKQFKSVVKNCTVHLLIAMILLDFILNDTEKSFEWFQISTSAIRFCLF